MIRSVMQQLQSAGKRGGLDALFGDLVFDSEDVEALRFCGDGERLEVRFSNESGSIGVLVVDLHDSGDPDEEGLTVGLRGWRLDEDVASV